MADAALLVRIVSDVRDGVDGMRQVKSEAGGLKGAMQKAQPAAKATAVALLAAGAAAAKYASDLQQSTGAVDSVFKEHAATVQANAQNAAQSVGLSTNAYQEMASVIGAQLKNMGIPMEKLAGQTDDLVTLGADLAATYGGTTSDAVAALSSLLRGETDPIEKYGVSIKAADVAAQKAKMGLSGLTGAADKQATAQATLALLSAQTADATGQFAREADSAAGSSQIAKAEFENAAAALGTALLPVATAAATALAEFGRWAQDNVPLIQGFAVAIGVLAGAILAYNAITKAIAIAQGIATAAQWAWNAAVTANPIGLIILAIAALIAIIVALVMNWDTVKAVAIAVWDAILAAVQSFWEWLIGWGEEVVAWFAGIWDRWVQANKAAWDAIIAAVTTYIDALKATIKSVVDWFVNTWDRIVQANAAVWRAVAGFVLDRINQVKGYVDRFVAFHRAAYDMVRQAAANAFGRIVAIVQGVIDKVQAVTNAVRNGLIGAWEAVTGTVSRFVDSVIGGLQRVIDMAATAGRRIRDALSGGGGLFGGFDFDFDFGNWGFAAPPSELTAAATVPAAAPSAVWTGSSSRRRSSGPTQIININVTGALDPRSVATQVRDLLNTEARLRGAVPLTGVSVT